MRHQILLHRKLADMLRVFLAHEGRVYIKLNPAGDTRDGIAHAYSSFVMRWPWADGHRWVRGEYICEPGPETDAALQQLDELVAQQWVTYTPDDGENLARWTLCR